MNKFPLLFILLLLGCKNESSEKNVASIIVGNDSELKYEEYFNGSAAGELMNVQSITKSIISILIGQAIDEGIVQNERITLGNYFPDISTDKKSITIEHLLNHTSGIQWEGFLEHEKFLKSKNPTDYVLAKKIENEPDMIYNYNSGGTHLLSAILTKASGRSTLEYAQEKLFTPLGINKVTWGKLNDGVYDGAGFSLEMFPKDLIKIGSIFLKESNNTEKLISNNWLQKMTSQDLKKETKWGVKNSKHGYGWYSSYDKNQKILYSMGYGGQFIFVLPDKELVIVSTHEHDTPRGIEQQVDFLKETFPELLEKYGS